MKARSFNTLLVHIRVAHQNAVRAARREFRKRKAVKQRSSRREVQRHLQRDNMFKAIGCSAQAEASYGSASSPKALVPPTNGCTSLQVATRLRLSGARAVAAAIALAPILMVGCGGGASIADQIAQGNVPAAPPPAAQPGGQPPAQNGGGGQQPPATQPPATQPPATQPPANGGIDAELAQLLVDAEVTAIAADQPEPRELVDLGRELFGDPLLSGNRNISCATCHSGRAGTSDALPTSIGEGGIGQLANRRSTDLSQVIPRNSPGLHNLGLPGVNQMFWDSRVSMDPATGILTTPEPALNGASPSRSDMTAVLNSPLAAQALFPVTSHAEMRGDPGTNEIADAATNQEVWERLMDRLVGTNNGASGGEARYRQLFREAFPQVQNFDDYNFAHAARAIAAFEKQRWTAVNSPFDRYLRGDTNALNDQEKRGAVLFFGDAGCGFCHKGPMLSDFDHHSVASPQIGPGKDNGDDLGRALVTGNPADNYKFRTPMLRNVALTAPYKHAGAFDSLAQVVRHYIDIAESLRTYSDANLPFEWRGTYDNDPTRQAERQAQVPAAFANLPNLTDQQVSDIVAFLRSLTDPRSEAELDGNGGGGGPGPGGGGGGPRPPR